VSKSVGLKSEEREGLYLENYLCADIYLLEHFFFCFGVGNSLLEICTNIFRYALKLCKKMLQIMQ